MWQENELELVAVSLQNSTNCNLHPFLLTSLESYKPLTFCLNDTACYSAHTDNAAYWCLA